MKMAVTRRFKGLGGVVKTPGQHMSSSLKTAVKGKTGHKKRMFRPEAADRHPVLPRAAAGASQSVWEEMHSPCQTRKFF